MVVKLFTLNVCKQEGEEKELIVNQCCWISKRGCCLIKVTVGYISYNVGAYVPPKIKCQKYGYIAVGCKGETSVEGVEVIVNMGNVRIGRR